MRRTATGFPRGGTVARLAPTTGFNKDKQGSGYMHSPIEPYSGPACQE